MFTKNTKYTSQNNILSSCRQKQIYWKSTSMTNKIKAKVRRKQKNGGELSTIYISIFNLVQCRNNYIIAAYIIHICSQEISGERIKEPKKSPCVYVYE